MYKPKRIVFIHSLNNYTGSPNVLSTVIKGFIAKGFTVDLITSRTDGFLSNIFGLNYQYTCYKWTSSKLKTFILLLCSQIQMFIKVLFYSKSDTLFYINSIIPFGAVWACKLTKRNFIYHIHENMQQKKPLYYFLRWTYSTCNKKSIFVSNYLKTTALNVRDSVVIHNTIDYSFVNKAEKYLLMHSDEKINILMVASLRKFKGIYEFIELSKKLSEYQFELVLSATYKEVSILLSETNTPENLIIYPEQNDLHKFYRRAKLLLQLSHPTEWIETFGLTILEAMYYGIPSIVPNVGGPTELVEDGKNGYLVNPHNLDDIIIKIKNLMQDESLYQLFSDNAIKKSKQFSETKMIDEIEKYILG